MMINYPEFEALLMEQEGGATTILFKYMNILKRYFSENADISRDEQKKRLNYLYGEVTTAHPLMAIFPNLHSFLFEVMDQCDDSIPNIVDTFAKNVNSMIENTIATCTKDLIKDGSKIFTFSHSSIVRKAIMRAARDGKRFDVLITEARPVSEGIALAKHLGRTGIPVSLYTDAAMELAISRSDLVLVGTDWYWGRGFVNKIGTHSALRIAEEREKKFYILTDSTKKMATPPSDWSKDRHPSNQLLMEQIDNVNVYNPYFESIWYRGVTNMIIDGKMSSFDKNGLLKL